MKLKHIHLAFCLLMLLLSGVVKADCLPIVGLGNEIRICKGNSVILNAQNSGATYQWSTGATSQTISVTQTGTYWVNVTNNCGTASDTVRVYVDEPINPNFGNVIGLCPTSSNPLVFRLPQGSSFLWSDNSTADSLLVTTPGTYWGSVTNACGTFSDTFQVVYSNQPNFDLGPDTVICAGENYQLFVPPGLGSIQWHNGSPSNTMWATTTRWYWATVTNDCGTYTDSVHVTVLPTPQVQIQSSIGICDGDSVLVQALSSLPPNTSVQWSNNTTGNFSWITAPGTYSVYIDGPCVKDTVTFTVIEVFPLDSIDLGPDTVLCGPFELIIDPPPGTNVAWHTGGGGDTIIVDQYTQIYVTLSNACGSVSDTMHVYTLLPPDSLPYDTLEICQSRLGSHPVMGPPGDSLRFIWSTGDTTAFIYPDTIGWISVTAFNRCDTLTDSMYIDIIPDLTPFSLPNDTTLCEGVGLRLDVTDPNAADSRMFEYNWYRNGSIYSFNPIVFISSPGQYVLEKHNTCDTLYDTIMVNMIYVPKRRMLPLIYSCIGDTVWLEPDTNGTFFQWNNNFQALNQPVTQTGHYAITIGNVCDTIVDSVHVIFDQPFPMFKYSDSIIVCEGPVEMFAPIPNQRYKWFNGWFGPSWTVETSGNYWVQVFNGCDTIVDVINVLITGPPASILGTYVTVCRGNSIMLDAGNPGSRYLWHSDSSSNRRLTVSEAGWYHVDIENDCGFLRDSVEVIVVDPVSVQFGEDTIMCDGESLVLNAGNVHSTYLWNTGETTREITVDTTGLYIVEVTNVCGTRSDSIQVTFLGVPEFSLDTVYKCFDADYARVYGPPGDLRYLWSTGDTTPSALLSQVGIFTLMVDNGCFTYTDTFWLADEYPLELNLGPDTFICKSDAPLILTADVPTRHTVRWNEDHQGHTFEVHVPGKYSASVENSCGVYGDTITVGFDEELPDEPRDRMLCKGDSFTLNLAAENHRVVSWYDGDTSLTKQFFAGGNYPYKVTNSCGMYDQLLRLSEENCECPFFIPNTFTPNNDGVNDYFAYGCDCKITSFDIQIFNRWGQRVFQSNNPTHFWDGTLNGTPAQTGTYIYIILYEWNDYDKEKFKEVRGMVNIIR
ncbi:MAG: gliding motility-associated C-terminal domain-containing protein [Cryomorphaceae bacterium]|nr:gliding motility-associated C-terminal domain-containing protein [Cryomorphaceae bacterium]